MPSAGMSNIPMFFWEKAFGVLGVIILVPLIFQILIYFLNLTVAKEVWSKVEKDRNDFRVIVNGKSKKLYVSSRCFGLGGDKRRINYKRRYLSSVIKFDEEVVVRVLPGIGCFYEVSMPAFIDFLFPLLFLALSYLAV